VVLTPRDAQWLPDNGCFVVSDVGVEMLEAGMAWRHWAATAELIRGLGSESVDFGADVRVAIHTRLVQPLLDATLLFLGLPLVLSRNNRNVFMAIGLCLMVVVLFMLVLITCQYLGTSSLIRPSLAAWLPLLIFVPLAVRGSQPLAY
jgi:lipopolysaccharide export system permease protein